MSGGYKMTELGELPDEWVIRSLDEIKQDGSSISYGVVQPGPEDPNGVLFIRGGDVKNGKIGNNLRTISQQVSNQYKRTVLKGGELLVSLVGYPGECAIVPECLAGANIARQVGVIRIKKSVNSLYIQQYLNSPTGKRNLLGNLVGSAQQVINLEMLRKVKIPLPSTDEQQRIAEILITVDEKIDVIDGQISKIQELKKGLMQQLLTKGIGHTQFKSTLIGEIPESWRVVKLGEHASKVGSGITPKGGQAAYVSQGVLFIRSQNVLRGKLDLSDVAYITNEQHDKMDISKLQPGDVLLNITGASIGRSCVFPMRLSEGNVNQHVCIIRTNEDLDATFLSQLLNSEYGSNQVDKFQAGGNREGLNYQQIRSFVIPLPPHSEQRKIADIFTTVDEKITVLEDKKVQYLDFKVGLMQQLMSGKIRTRNADIRRNKAVERETLTEY